MLCDKCQKELTPTTIQECVGFLCPHKEPSNTSGKVNQLFRVSGNGFEVDNVKMLDNYLTDI